VWLISPPRSSRWPRSSAASSPSPATCRGSAVSFAFDQSELLANLRELADTWEEKYAIVSADLATSAWPTPRRRIF